MNIIILYKTLAKLEDLTANAYREFMVHLNNFARKTGLQEYQTYSRIWEYPWIWFHLEPLKGRGLRVLDIGSERSPFPWFLATQGFKVIVSDVTAQYWRIWQKASQRLKVDGLEKRILDAQNLDLPTASVDIYLSISVIEHVPDKARAIAEAARVLRPGGLLIMTFDICEADMGMTFPEWNGRALTMREFDELFDNCPWFESGLSKLRWNVEDIPEYLAWHRTTNPWHNYVTGAAVVRRNGRAWQEPGWKDYWRIVRGNIRSMSTVADWYVKNGVWKARQVVVRRVKFVGRKALAWLVSPKTAILSCEPLFWLIGMRRKSDRLGLSQAKRVLVVRLDEIGDVVMTTPFLRELRRNLPDAWITLVVKPQVYNLVERCPYVNEVLTFDWHVQGRLCQLRRHGRALRLAWQRLWRRRFDLAIVPRWDVDYYHATFLAYFSGARWRVGYSEQVTVQKKQANKGFDRLLTHPLNDSNLKHEVEHNLDVIRHLGGCVQDDRLELWLSGEDEAFAERFLSNYRVGPEDLLVALAPGAGAPKRMWPMDRFTRVGRWLQETYGARLLIVGGPGEEPLGEELERTLGPCVVNTVGRTTLRQTAALLKRCRLFMGNDAGPMHLAAAAGIPVVEISCHPKCGRADHYNSPLRFRPWGVPCVVLQPERPLVPCKDGCEAPQAHCITQIETDAVKEAIQRLLATSSAQVSGLDARLGDV